MFFSYTDFEDKKKDLLQEFATVPTHFLIPEKRLTNEAEYQKILNDILYRKKHQKKSMTSTKRLQSAVPSQRRLKRF